MSNENIFKKMFFVVWSLVSSECDYGTTAIEAVFAHTGTGHHGLGRDTVWHPSAVIGPINTLPGVRGARDVSFVLCLFLFILA